MFRVLRPGGRLAYTKWVAQQDNPPYRAIRDAIAARDADAARAEMRAHLVRVESDVHTALAVSPAARGGNDG